MNYLRYFTLSLLLSSLLWSSLIAQNLEDTLCFQLKTSVFEGDSITAAKLLQDTTIALADCYSYNEPTALHYAIQGGFTGIVEMLLGYGAQPDGAYNHDYPPLNLAVMLGQHQSAELLILYGATLNQQDIHGFTPLTRAVQIADLGMADMLIHYGAAVNEKDGEGYTPLSTAAAYDDTLFARFLIDAGATDLALALSTAICSSSPAMIAMLLPLTPAETRTAMLNLALRTRNKKSLQYLQAYGLKPSCKPYIVAWQLTQQHSWSGKEMLMGWSLGAKEMRYNTRWLVGFDFRTKPTLVFHNPQPDPVSYQMSGKRNHFFVGADKHLRVLTRPGYNLDLRLGGTIGYSGGHFKGSTMKPYQGFFTAYRSGIVLETNTLTLSAGYLRLQISEEPVPKGRFGVEAGFFLHRKKTIQCLP